MWQFFVSVMVVVSVGLVLSLFTVTQAIRRAVVQNCCDRHGSLSRSRLRRECRAYLSYVSNIAVPCVLSIPMVLIAIQFVNDTVIPLRLATEAISNYDVDQDQWKSNLGDVRTDHAEWLSASKNMSNDEVVAAQQDLWYTWPSIVAGIIGLIMFAGWILVGASRNAVIDYVKGVRLRRNANKRLDLIRLSAEFEEATSNQDRQAVMN